MANKDKEFLILVRADIQRALVDLRAVSKEIDATGRTGDAAAKQVRNLSNASGELEGSLTSLKTIVTSVGAGFAAWRLGDVIKDSTLLSARIETLGVVVDVVGRNTGHTRGEMARYVSEVKNMGITSQIAAQSVIRMAQANLDLEKAAKLARVAQDAAVVGGTNSSEALQRLIYGIVTLQPEMLRTIGITLNFQQEYQLAAKQMDRNVNSLSANERQQIAFNAALREGQRLSGAYANAMETVGKQIGSLDRITQTTEEELGNLFKPALATGVSLWQKILEQAGKNLRDFNLILGTTGLETKPLEAIDGEIKRVTDDIEKMRKEQEKSGAYSGYGDNLFIKQLQFQLFMLRRIREERAKSHPAAAKATPEFVGPPEPSAELVDLRKKTQDLSKDLREQAATLGLSNEALARYRLTMGDLKGTEQSYADQLILSARALDEKRAAIARAQKATVEQQRAAEVAKRNAAADNGLILSLEEQIALYGQTDREQAVHQAVSRLTADATDEQRRSVEALAGAMFDLMVITQENEAAQGAWAARMADAEQMLRDAYTAADTYSDVVIRLTAALERGDISEATYNTLLVKAQGGLRDLAKTGEASFQDLIAAEKGWGDEFTNTLAAAARSGKLSFKDLADSAISDLLRIQIYQGITQPFFGKLFPDAFPTPTKHSGGIAGGDGGGFRYVSPATFARAPRYHGGGIAGNEVATVLQKGEGIFTQGQMKALGAGLQGGNGEVRVTIDNRGVPKEAQQAQVGFDLKGMVVNIIVDDARRGGPASGALSDTFGLQRRA